MHGRKVLLIMNEFPNIHKIKGPRAMIIGFMKPIGDE